MATDVLLSTASNFMALETVEDLRSELIHGELILSPDPKPFRQDVAANIFMPLHRVLALRN